MLPLSSCVSSFWGSAAGAQPLWPKTLKPLESRCQLFIAGWKNIRIRPLVSALGVLLSKLVLLSSHKRVWKADRMPTLRSCPPRRLRLHHSLWVVQPKRPNQEKGLDASTTAPTIRTCPCSKTVLTHSRVRWTWRNRTRNRLGVSSLPRRLLLVEDVRHPSGRIHDLQRGDCSGAVQPEHRSTAGPWPPG